MNPIYSIELEGAGMWSKVIRRGRRLRFTDLQGGANLSLLLYHSDERHERYNMPDTLKGQQIFHLSQGACLHSDMGRILASITEDSMGWHDTVCGVSSAESVLEKFGESSYQKDHNEWHRNGRECFLIELAKWGLGEESLIPNVNFFSKVSPDENGSLHHHPEASPAGTSVTLRLEMDCLVVLNTCPHPLTSTSNFAPKPVRLQVYDGPDEVPRDDECRTSHPENERAFLNTEHYLKLRY